MMKKIISLILTFMLLGLSVNVYAEDEPVTNLIAAGNGGSITVSWNNGDMSSVARIEVYEGSSRLASSAANPKTGVTVPTSENGRLSKASDTQNIVVISGLSEGVEYSYKVVTTSSVGEKKEYFTNTVTMGNPADGWECRYDGYAMSYAELTNDAIVGDVAVKLVSGADEVNKMEFVPEFVASLTEGTKYKLEYYAKSDDNGKITVSEEQVEEINLTSDWKKHTHIFEYIGEDVKFIVSGKTSGIYLDWVSVYETDDDGKNIGDNFVSNGNFEGKSTVETSAVAESFNFMAVGRDRSLSVSWRNPKVNNIKKITVYDENETEIASSDKTGISTASGISNSVWVKNLSNGKKHKFSLRIDYKDGTSYCTETYSNILGDAGEMLWGAPRGVQEPEGWMECVSEGTYAKIDVTSAEKNSGNASLLVRNNLDKALGNTFQRFGPDLTVADGGNYRFTFYAKAVNTDNFVIRYDRDGKEARYDVNIGTSDWKQYSFDVTSHAVFQFERRADALYIDDCEFYEIDANGNKIGDNLIVNGGFEEGFETTPPEEVDGVSGELGMNTAYLAWDSEPADAVYVHIYTKNGDGEYLRAVVEPGKGAAVLNGGVSNEFIIRTVNVSGVESEGVTVSCTPSPVEIAEPVLTMDGQAVEALVPGKVNITRKIKNNGMGDEYSGAMIAALYEGNVMKQYKTSYKILPETGISSGPAEFSIDIDIDEVTENTVLKVFMWDSMENKNSISDVIVFR